MIEIEPTEWRSKCGRYDIDRYVIGETFYRATERNLESRQIERSDELPTFAAAVAWCESRAAAGQGGGK